MSAERTERQAEMLANRLAKNARNLRRWAERERLTCYRLYDRDIPEVPLIIDWYDGHLHIAARLRQDERDRPGWLEALVAAAARTLDVPADRVFLKQRQRQRGGHAHQLPPAAGGRAGVGALVVTEDDLRFHVDLDAYLDTGLFLDHRPLRRRIRAEAAGRRVLNLFSYTGSLTVAAAVGGAASSVSVDMSRTYLEWARANLALNGQDRREHVLHQADVLKFLAEPPHPPGSFDLAVLDPPTFSASKRMDDILDIERDHVRLIERTLRLVAPGGTLFFSTNKRRFRIDPAIAAEDITESTIPPDFRDRNVHRCYRIVR